MFIRIMFFILSFWSSLSLKADDFGRDSFERYLEETMNFPSVERINALRGCLPCLICKDGYQDLYWEGLRVLTVLKGDGWEEAQIALWKINSRGILSLPENQKNNVQAEEDQREEDKAFFKNEGSRRPKLEALLKMNLYRDEAYLKSMAKFLYDSEIMEKKENLRVLRYNEETNEIFLSRSDSLLESDGKGDIKAFHPLREDMVGRYGFEIVNRFSGIWHDFSLNLTSQYGWEIQITAYPSSAQKIMETTLSCLKDDVLYRFIATLPSFRLLNLLSRYDGKVDQRGRIMVVYPKDDEDANKIVNDFNAAFQKKFDEQTLSSKDFYPLTGEYQVGTTGGIFARLCHYNDYNQKERRRPFISKRIVKAHLYEEIKNLRTRLKDLKIQQTNDFCQQIEQWSGHSWEKPEIQTLIRQLQDSIQEQEKLEQQIEKLDDKVLHSQDYECPFDLSVFLYGEPLGKKVSEWPFSEGF